MVSTTIGPEPVTAYDGFTDYKGSSGFSRTVSKSGSTSAPIGLDMIGQDQLDFNVSSTGSFSESGPSNIDFSCSSSSGANVRIVYEYNPLSINSGM